MNLDIASCGTWTTAGEALAIIGSTQAVQPEALLQIHVLDEYGRLTGVVPVIALLQAHPADLVEALMDSDPIRVSPDSDLTDVAVLMADYDLHTIPVIDGEGQVLGVVTVDDVLKAIIPDDWRRREPAPRLVREDPTWLNDGGGNRQ